MLTSSLVPGCGEKDEDPPFPDPDLPAAETNPDGVPYPTDHIGGAKRSGRRPGDRIPNLTFRAYLNGTGGGLETLSLSNYFDPDQRRYKLLHLQVAATWCAVCSSELEATVGVKEQLAERGVVFLEVVISGKTAGKGPALSEVDGWMKSHQTNFATAIDVAGRRLGTIGVSTSVVPHDILVDPRTMEILDSSPGAPLDVVKYVEAGLEFVDESAPSYPTP